jgi:RimJ/RimL family protein N-acetyltransferase
VSGAAPSRPAIRVEPWGAEDLPLLALCVGEESMMGHLGGPESAAKIAERQARYERPGSGQFKIVVLPGEQRAGWVGYWEREWQGEQTYEIGWAVIPQFQGRGIAGAAAGEALAAAAAQAGHRYVHAYPGVENVASNAVCRRLGFVLLGACEVEYPPGSSMACNDWRFDLLARD